MNIESILKDIPDKRDNKNTTSLVMKKDLINFFGDNYLNKKCFEIGTNRGYTTRVLSFLFETVKTIELDNQLINFAKDLNKDRKNINYVQGDVYKTVIKSDNWWDNDNNSLVEKYDVFFIDCVHDAVHVALDIKKALDEGTDDVILVFDDYGLPENTPSVKVAVEQAVMNGFLKVVKYIGEPAGEEPRRGRKLVDWEGVICQRA